MKKNKLLICWTAFVLPDERKEMPPSYRIVVGSLPSWCHALLNRQEVDKILRQQPAPLLDNKRKSSFCFSTAAIIDGNLGRSNEFELLFIENKKYWYLIFSVYHTDNLTQYTYLNWINDWTIFCKKKTTDSFCVWHKYNHVIACVDRNILRTQWHWIVIDKHIMCTFFSENFINQKTILFPSNVL